MTIECEIEPNEHRVGDRWRRTRDSTHCTVCDVVGGARMRYADGSISGPHGSPELLMKLGWTRTHREAARPAPPAPYVPQVGDVVEWTRDGAQFACVPAGDRGIVVGVGSGWVDVQPPDSRSIHGGRWGACLVDLRLIERPRRAAVADEAPPITAHLPSLRRALGPVRFGGLFRAAPEPSVADDRYPHRCHQGHRAWAPFGAARECPTCDAIRVVRNDEPWAVRPGVVKGEPCMHVDHRGAVYTHPTRDGAIALWRAAEVARLDREGRA